MKVDEQLIYIAGSGRSGSTLLDLLLNNSEQVQTLGEFHRLSWYVRTNHEPCTCGQTIDHCPFWTGIEEEARRILRVDRSVSLLKSKEVMLWADRIGVVGNILQKSALLGRSPAFFSLVNGFFCPDHHRFLHNSLFWYGVIRKATGKPVLVESTKDARRMKALYFLDPLRTKIIFMVRDGRAVAASAIRRTGIDMDSAAKEWVHANRMAMSAMIGLPEHRIFRLRYEDLCNDPERKMAQICRFIGIPWTKSILTMNKKVAHNIGGNPMRFRQGETTIRLDDRWREQLDDYELNRFAGIGGGLNRRFGYRELSPSE